MNFNFTYKNLQGKLSQSMWSGREKLFINGQEVQKSGKEWVLSDGTRIATKKEFLLFPKLVINGEEVKIIKLKKWEWVFVILPGFLFFLGGAVPALVGLGGVYLNLSIFMSHDIKPAVKILASLGYLILALIIVFGVAALLQA